MRRFPNPPVLLAYATFVLIGYGTGVLESVLNAYLAALPDSTVLLNRLHAFFGVGALVGPVLATWVVGRASWPVVWLVVAVAAVPLVAGFFIAYPRHQTSQEEPGAPERAGLRAVLLLVVWWPIARGLRRAI